jgi:hypothetical protein
MNPNEPKDFQQLYLWLERMWQAGDFPHLFPKQLGEQCNTAQNVWTWLVLFETPHLEAIEKATRNIWLHEEAVFQDLQFPANSLLRVRIEQVRDLIEGFLTKQETPFAYPDTTFQDLIEWLLVDWWEHHGRHRASIALFLRA